MNQPHPEDFRLQHRLFGILRELGTVVVAYSGGVDSSFLAWTAREVLGQGGVLAITGDSPTLAREEFQAAQTLAASLGIPWKSVATGELENPAFAANPRDRCFHCKDELFPRLRELAAVQGFRWVVDGTNADDLQGHRPGRRAAELHGVRSPLAEAGLGKDAIRRLSRAAGLPTWNKPQMACLASRFPSGKPITAEELARVEEAERYIRGLGFRNVRVRVHGDVARVELDRERLPDLFPDFGALIGGRLKGLGFRFVAIDVEGFRSGSLSS